MSHLLSVRHLRLWPNDGSQEQKRRAKERAEAQKQVEALLAATRDEKGEDTATKNGGHRGTKGDCVGGTGTEAADSAKRAKALTKKLKKLEGLKEKKAVGEAINEVRETFRFRVEYLCKIG